MNLQSEGLEGVRRDSVVSLAVVGAGVVPPHVGQVQHRVRDGGVWGTRLQAHCSHV